jgi:16S rRNA processing protein RimM
VESPEPSDPIVIGFIGPPHGVRGTVRVRPAGTGRHLREGVEPFIGAGRRRIIGARATGKGFLVDFEGIGSREEAEALRSEELRLERSELDEPDEGEFYVEDLVGLTALGDSGEAIGVVSEVFETPAHEVLSIRSDAGELLVPFTLEYVPEVHVDAGHIVVLPPTPDD